MSRPSIGILFTLIFCIGWCPLAISTTYPIYTLRDISVGSDAVILGTVINIDERVYHGTEVYTHIVINVSRSVNTKGTEVFDVDQKLTLRHWGGLVDDGRFIDRWEITDTPRFVSGERVVLFVSRNAVSDLPIFGGSQGVYRILENNTVVNNVGGELRSLNPDVPLTNLVDRGFSAKTIKSDVDKPVLVEYDVVAVPREELSNDGLTSNSNRGISIEMFFDEVALLRSAYNSRARDNTIYLNENLPDPPVKEQVGSNPPSE